MEKNKQLLEFKGFLSFLILHELSKKSLCGEDLAIRIGKRKGSQLTPGTIYPSLKRLKKLKLVKLKKVGRKKYYSLLVAGREELEVQYELFATYFYGLKQFITRKRVKKTTKDFTC
jgi:DNA-binding PadR family transcriptional regulator